MSQEEIIKTIKLCEACKLSHIATIKVDYEIALGSKKAESIPIIFLYRCPNKDSKKMKVKFYFDVDEIKIFKGARIIDLK